MASILLQDGPLHKGKTGKRKIPDIVYKITFTCIKVLILVGELNLAYTQASTTRPFNRTKGILLILLDRGYWAQMTIKSSSITL